MSPRRFRLFKILSAQQWSGRDDLVPRAPIDVADGFVHLSDEQQVRETARLHFAGRDDLVLIELDPDLLVEGTLRWEPSRGGVLFPHVYGDVPSAAVLDARPLPYADGRFVFPDDVP